MRRHNGQAIVEFILVLTAILIALIGARHLIKSRVEKVYQKAFNYAPTVANP